MCGWVSGCYEYGLLGAFARVELEQRRSVQAYMLMISPCKRTVRKQGAELQVYCQANIRTTTGLVKLTSKNV